MRVRIPVSWHLLHLQVNPRATQVAPGPRDGVAPKFASRTEEPRMRPLSLNGLLSRVVTFQRACQVARALRSESIGDEPRTLKG